MAPRARASRPRRFCRRLALVLFAACTPACASTPDPSASAAQAPVPTFTKDIAPVLYANCVPCHRPGQAAPFSLIEYQDVRSRADKIAKAVAARRMPPWLPAPSNEHFVGERRLRDDQIAVLQRWADAGAPEGARADLPPPPVHADGWQSGRPDLVLIMPKPFLLPAGKGDRYRHVVFPLSLPAGHFVRTVEFRTGNAPIHHAVIRVDRTHASRRRDGADGQPGFDGLMAPDIQNPDGQFIGWTPGQGPIESPAGMPWRLERGSDLVVELHLIERDAPVSVQPTIGLFFTDRAPTATPISLTMGVKTLDIPAGERAYHASASYTFPVAVTLVSLYPHAHYLGKDMQVIALLPGGASRLLLHIPRWEFHWQQDYRFTTPVALPAGTTLSMQYTYDNSSGNDENPSTPPRRVLYGTRSTDEMANLAMQVLPASPADGPRLVKAFAARDAAENVASAELLARADPGSSHNQWYLGRSYVEIGRPADALAPLEQALRLDPQSATAHDYLARALFGVHRIDDALEHARRAVALAPNDEVMRIDLGKLLVENGRLGEGAQAFQQALAINPEYSQAYQGLGVIFVRARRFGEAIAAFERAVALTPESAEAHNGLGVALGQAGRTGEAIAQVRRALELDPDNESARQNLGWLTKKK